MEGYFCFQALLKRIYLSMGCRRSFGSVQDGYPDEDSVKGLCTGVAAIAGIVAW